MSDYRRCAKAKPSCVGLGKGIKGYHECAKKKECGKKKKAVVKKKGGKNPWFVHVAEFRKKNPNVSYKNALVMAKKTYKKNVVKKVETKKKKKKKKINLKDIKNPAELHYIIMLVLGGDESDAFYSFIADSIPARGTVSEDEYDDLFNKAVINFNKVIKIIFDDYNIPKKRSDLKKMVMSIIDKKGWRPDDLTEGEPVDKILIDVFPEYYDFLLDL